MKKFVTVVFILFFLLGCASSDYNSLVRASLSKKPTVVLKSFAQKKSTYYISHPKQLVRDISFLTHFKTNISKFWGKNNIVIPQKKEYVKYLQNYKSRVLIDFTKGRVRVETLGSKKNLKQSIVTALLLPDDPRSVDLFGAKNVKLGGMPYLFGEVQDDMGKNIRYKWRANRYAIMNPKIKTTKSNILISPLYDTSGNRFTPFSSKLLSA